MVSISLQIFVRVANKNLRNLMSFRKVYIRVFCVHVCSVVGH